MGPQTKVTFAELPFPGVDLGGLGEDAVRAFVATLGHKEVRFD